jgi:hypothetical protein
VFKNRSFLLAAACLALSPPLLAQTGVGAPYGARDPVACPSLKQAQAPSPQQAAVLVRCKRETLNSGSGELWLMENTVVDSIGPAQHFTTLYNVLTMANADTTKPVHVIKGSWRWVVCISRKGAGANADVNCRETPVTGATGGCWRTTAGEWACAMNGRSGETRQGVRAPR